MTIIEMGKIDWLQSATFEIGAFLDDLGHDQISIDKQNDNVGNITV